MSPPKWVARNFLWWVNPQSSWLLILNGATSVDLGVLVNMQECEGLSVQVGDPVMNIFVQIHAKDVFLQLSVWSIDIFSLQPSQK